TTRIFIRRNHRSFPPEAEPPGAHPYGCILSPDCPGAFHSQNFGASDMAGKCREVETHFTTPVSRRSAAGPRFRPPDLHRIRRERGRPRGPRLPRSGGLRPARAKPVFLLEATMNFKPVCFILPAVLSALAPIAVVADPRPDYAGRLLQPEGTA